MNFKAITITALSVAGLAACGPKGAQEAQKIETRAQLSGTFSLCEPSAAAIVGFKSVRTAYNNLFPSGTKTITYFVDANCQNEGLALSYTGDTKVGANTGGEGESAGSNIIDINFTKVEGKVSNQTVADTLNSAVVPSCGINDWKVGTVVDLTEKSRAGGVTCAMVPSPNPVFDIAKTDGQTLTFGKGTDAEKSKEESRPKHLDMDRVFRKK